MAVSPCCWPVAHQVVESHGCSQFDNTTGAWVIQGMVVVGFDRSRSVVVCASMFYGDFAVTVNRGPGASILNGTSRVPAMT